MSTSLSYGACDLLYDPFLNPKHPLLVLLRRMIISEKMEHAVRGDTQEFGAKRNATRPRRRTNKGRGEENISGRCVNKRENVRGAIESSVSSIQHLHSWIRHERDGDTPCVLPSRYTKRELDRPIQIATRDHVWNATCDHTLDHRAELVVVRGDVDVAETTGIGCATTPVVVAPGSNGSGAALTGDEICGMPLSSSEFSIIA